MATPDQSLHAFESEATFHVDALNLLAAQTEKFIANPHDYRVGIGSRLTLTVAALERHFAELLRYVHTSISQSGYAISDLGPGPRAIAVRTDFDEIGFHSCERDRRKDCEWDHRLRILSDRHEPVDIPRFERNPVWGGTTLSTQNIARIWRVYGFPDEPCPQANWDLAVRTSVDFRNDFAHGTPMDELLPFASPTAATSKAREFATAATRIVQYGRYIADAVDTYVDGKMYLIAVG